MRCSCPACGTYMIHSESVRLGCVCPECGARCDACLGTNTVVSRESLKDITLSGYAFEERFAMPQETETEEDADVFFDED